MTGQSVSIPVADGVAAAAVVEAHRSAAVDAVTEGIYDRLGDRLERFGERGRAYCRDDLDSHIDYIVGALIAGTPAPFGDYVVWLRELLESRGVPAESVDLSTELLAGFFRAHLDTDEREPVLAVIEDGETARDGTAAPAVPFRTPVGVEIHPSTESLAESLVIGSRADAKALVNAAASELGYLHTAVGLIQPAMYRIGEWWHRREIGVAEEHLATALAQRLLVEQFTAAAAASPVPHGPGSLFACVPSNQHALGLRIVADAFELEGWSVEYLGADTPAVDLVERIVRIRPRLVGLSVSMVWQLHELRELTERIRERMGDEAPRIVAGGLGLVRVSGAADRLGLDGWYSTAVEMVEAQQ